MSENETGQDRVERGRVPWIALSGLVLAGLGLRLLAAGKSFWLDELHSTELAHASFGEMIRLLRPDFHAPLFFGFAGLAEAVGLAGHELRIVPAIGSVLALVPFVLLARQARAGCEALIAGAALLLLAPFQIRYGVELRPYACLQFATLAAAWAAFDTRAAPKWRILILAVAAAVGLYSHYLAAVAILALGCARLLTPFGGRLAIWKVVAAGTLGVALFLPWVLEVESWILSDPGVLTRDESQDEPDGRKAETVERPTRGFAHHRDDLVALPARTFAPGGSSLGSPGRELVFAGLGLVVLAIIGGILPAIFRRDRHAGAALWGPLVMGLIAIAITAVLCVRIWERLPIQYFATGAFFWAPLAAIAVHGYAPGRARLIAALVVALGALLGGTGEALGEPREDLEAATLVAVDLAARENAHLTAILRQPGHYSNTEVYRVYAPAAPRIEPESVPRDDRKVVVLTRSTPLETLELPVELVGAIEDGRVIASRRDFSGGVSVYLFEPRP